MDNKIQEYLADKKKKSMEELGISYYNNYNDILLCVFESLINDSYSAELSRQLTLISDVFSKLIGKLYNENFNYENDDFLKEYNALIPVLNMYYINKRKVDNNVIKLLKEYFNRIKIVSKNN
jgi:hypothetical protein